MYQPTEKKKGFSISGRLKNLRCAIKGLVIVFKEEHNIPLYLGAAILIAIGGTVFQISKLDWLFMIVSFGFMLALEVVNTALENVADYIAPGFHPQIGRIKDMAAAAVLVGFITWVAIVVIIFSPKVLNFT